MKIFYDHNIATKKIGMIFVNTTAKGLEWKNAEENGQRAYKLFHETMGFNEVNIHTDFTKQ